MLRCVGFMFAAVRGPAAARAPAPRAPGRARAAAPGPALAPRDVRCRGQDLVLHPKIPRSPIRLCSRLQLTVTLFLLTNTTHDCKIIQP